MKLAPIALFVYNRPDHTLKTLEALRKNKYASESHLFIFSDGPKVNAQYEDTRRINEVRKIISQSKWCKEVTIIEQERNLGLSEAIISGVTRLLNEFKKVIVIEDDIVTSEGFLEYINTALELYKLDESVMQINAFNFPLNFHHQDSTFFVTGITSPWGWGTWKRAWDQLNTDGDYLLEKVRESKENYKRFNFEGRVNHGSTIESWDIKWYATVFLKKGLVLWPTTSYVNNIGHDGSGTHCPPSDIYKNKVMTTSGIISRIAIEETHDYLEDIIAFYDKIERKQRRQSNFKKFIKKLLLK